MIQVGVQERNYSSHRMAGAYIMNNGLISRGRTTNKYVQIITANFFVRNETVPDTKRMILFLHR